MMRLVWVPLQHEYVWQESTDRGKTWHEWFPPFEEDHALSVHKNHWGE